jgi:hypothetical protein
VVPIYTTVQGSNLYDSVIVVPIYTTLFFGFGSVVWYVFWYPLCILYVVLIYTVRHLIVFFGFRYVFWFPLITVHLVRGSNLCGSNLYDSVPTAVKMDKSRIAWDPHHFGCHSLLEFIELNL